MDKIKRFLPIIIVIVIGSFIMIKNADFIDNKDSYVVSEAENSNNEENKNEIEPNKDIDNNKEVKIDKLESTNYNKSQSDNENVGENYHVKNSGKITIYVSGEVNSPGVVELDSNDRLIDGVKLCQGLTKDADINNINLAMKIQDEGHYVIPKIGENIPVNTQDNINVSQNTDTNSNANQSVNNNTDNSKVNINSADITQLDSLPGVGEVTAQKIIDYREKNANFKSIEEIKNVKGIGENKFNDLKDYISI